MSTSSSEDRGLVWTWLALGLLPLLGRAFFGGWSEAELGFAVVIVIFASRTLWLERRAARPRAALRARPIASYAQSVNGPAERGAARAPTTHGGAERPQPWAGYLTTVALVLLATAIGTATRAVLAAPDQVMLYLLAIGSVAAVFGRGPALLASVASVVSYDFFFVPPLYTFAVHDLRHLLTFAMMFVVGLLTSHMSHRIRQRAQAARTEELRSTLLSAVSHDLRTPLAAITGAATTLRESLGRLSTREQTELLDTVCEEAERLERLVRNLLDMTRLQSGALEVKREWVPLEELVGAALGHMEGQLVGRPITTRWPADLPLLSVDPVLMEQVLVNLLENAGKHTPANSPLDIEARATDAALVIDVADRGPGIASEARQRVFERFARGTSRGVTPRVQGVGLGLAICRCGLILAHGGTIEALERVGGGARFRITLPRRGEPPAVPEAAELAREQGAPSG